MARLNFIDPNLHTRSVYRVTIEYYPQTGLAPRVYKDMINPKAHIRHMDTRAIKKVIIEEEALPGVFTLVENYYPPLKIKNI